MNQNNNPARSEEDIEKPLEKKFSRIVSPFQSFMRDQTTASLILILGTLIALILANTDLATTYHHLLQATAGLVVSDWSLKMNVHHWINDGLMAIFFFILGLEIKREILVGELKTPERAIPVMAAALGGMLSPAILYALFNTATISQHGWGIPMATDTAFAVGILALLGQRIPGSLLTFLAALAIIDDIGAILVIAFAYTKNIHTTYILVACLLLVFLILLNALGVRRPFLYLLVGLFVWYAMLLSGIHATIAGILVAFTVPARPKKGKQWFLRHVHRLLKQLENIEKQRSGSTPILAEGEQHAVLETVEETAKKTTTPLQRWESGLEHPVALFVLPIFALTNAGVAINSDTFTSLFNQPLSLGIILALVVGKCLGITLFAWLMLKAGWGSLPPNMNLRHLFGIGLLGGVGFTMSIFISNLSFAELPELTQLAKSSILCASLIAGILGYTWLFITGNRTRGKA